jgi:hypothetical protein
MHREDQVVKAAGQGAGQVGVREGVPEAGTLLAGGSALFVSNT